MNTFTELQRRVLKQLKTYNEYSLAQLAAKLNENKSTVLYQLEELVEHNLIIRKEYSSKNIKYKLATKSDLEAIIASHSEQLNSILIRTRIEGLEAYKDLLDLAANGEGDIIGYGNLERKIVPEMETMIESFRDKVALAGRIDRFVLPDSLRNIELLRDHFRKPEWRKVFKGRIIERDKMYVNADIYVWDGTVGICSFDNQKFEVTIHTDRITYETYKSLLEVLWEAASEID